MFNNFVCGIDIIGACFWKFTITKVFEKTFLVEEKFLEQDYAALLKNCQGKQHALGRVCQENRSAMLMRNLEVENLETSVWTIMENTTLRLKICKSRMANSTREASGVNLKKLRKWSGPWRYFTFAGQLFSGKERGRAICLARGFHTVDYIVWCEWLSWCSVKLHCAH